MIIINAEIQLAGKNRLLLRAVIDEDLIAFSLNCAAF